MFSHQIRFAHLSITASLALLCFACADDEPSGSDSGTDASVDATPLDDASSSDGSVSDASVADATGEASSADGGVDLTEVIGEVWSVHQSGPRLRARIAETALGAQQFLGWRDTELNIDCDFRTAADGSLRCLPSVTRRWVIKLYYDDVDCTMPVAHLFSRDACEAASDYISFFDSDSCFSNAPETIYRIGDEITDKSNIHKLDGESCESAAGIGVTLYALAEELAPADFVGATVVEKESAGGVVRLDLVADDGSSQHWGYRDQPRGFDCEVRQLAGGAYACVPSDAAFIRTDFGYFADVQCKTHVGYQVDPNRCRDPLDYSLRQTASCPAEVEVYENEETERAENTALYRDVRGQCTASEMFDSSRFYNTTRMLEASDLGEAQLVVGAVRGGIEERLYQFGGTTLGRAYWVDRKLDVPCELDAVAEDGETRCVPEGEGAQYNGAYYADSRCGQPLVQATACHRGLARAESDSCPRTRAIYTTAGGHSGDIYRGTGGCSKVLDKSMLTGSFLKVGRKVEAAEFVETSLRVE